MVGPSGVKSLIKLGYKSRATHGRPPSIILLGPPGVGKTVSVQEAARELAKEMGLEFWDVGNGVESIDLDKVFLFMQFSILHADPVDFMGVPREANGSTKYLLPDILEVFTRKDAKGIVFIDEFTLDSRPDRRSALLKLVDEGMLGYRTLSSGVMVVLAGNTKEWSNLADEIDEPLRRGRAKIVFVRSPSITEWIQYMVEAYGDGWDTRIAGYLSLYKDELFIKRGSDDDGYTPLNSPRNWTRLSLELKNSPDLDDEVLGALIGAYVCKSSAVKLMTYLKTYIPPLEDVKMDVWSGLKPEAKFLLVSQAPSRLKDGKDGFDRYAEFLRCLAEDPEYLSLLACLLDKQTLRNLLLYVRRVIPKAFEVLKKVVTEL